MEIIITRKKLHELSKSKSMNKIQIMDININPHLISEADKIIFRDDDLKERILKERV